MNLGENIPHEAVCTRCGVTFTTVYHAVCDACFRVLYLAFWAAMGQEPPGEHLHAAKLARITTTGGK